MEMREELEEVLEDFWTEAVERGVDARPRAEAGGAGALQELADAGLVRLTPAEAFLTDRGMEEARLTVRRHRLAERLLADVLDLRGGMAEETACKFEHLLHRGVEERICTLLGHPESCPHGKQIPPGSCCREQRDLAPRVIIPLAEMEPGQGGTVAYLQTPDPPRMRKLLAMGVLPGTFVRVIGRWPSVSFEVGFTQLAVDEELARDIRVRLDVEAPASPGRRTRPAARGARAKTARQRSG